MARLFRHRERAAALLRGEHNGPAVFKRERVYLYRAVDGAGQVVDVLFRERRDLGVVCGPR